MNMLASFLVLVYLNAVSWEEVKFRGRACQRRDMPPAKGHRTKHHSFGTTEMKIL
jgi:hypothetical protein